MAEFLRPEARAALWRWREVLAALAVLALGLWWGLTAFGILRWLGLALALGGLAAGFAALQRLRFAPGGGGRGVVQVDEARVTYLGPFGGGTADLGDLVALDIDHASRPAHWWLIRGDGSALAVPVDAEGAEGLLDAFAVLPGLSPGAVIRALDRGTGRQRLWHRPGTLPAA